MVGLCVMASFYDEHWDHLDHVRSAICTRNDNDYLHMTYFTECFRNLPLLGSRSMRMENNDDCLNVFSSVCVCVIVCAAHGSVSPALESRLGHSRIVGRIQRQ